VGTREPVNGTEARSPALRGTLRGLSAVVLAILGLGLFLTSPAFGVKEVVVIGSAHLTAAEVTAICDILPGTNILKVPTRAIRDRLLAVPRIAEATVSRRLPSRILVEVVEREGVALLPCQEEYAEVDAQGRPLELHRYIGALGLPVISGITVEGVTLGRPLADDRLRAVLVAAAALGTAGRQAVSEIHIGGAGELELTLYTRGGIPVYLGPPTGLDAKVAAFLRILPDIKNEALEVSYVDVRYPRYPVVGSPGQVSNPDEWPGSDPDAELLRGP